MSRSLLSYDNYKLREYYMCFETVGVVAGVEPPPLMADIARVTALKSLGATFTDTLSTSQHISEDIKSCAQTQYALRVLRATLHYNYKRSSDRS